MGAGSRTWEIRDELTFRAQSEIIAARSEGLDASCLVLARNGRFKGGTFGR